MSRSLYDILGVPFDASSDEIKSAYRRLAKTVHPDLSGEDGSEDSGDRFRELQSAYEVLSDAAKRLAYDQSRSRRAVSWTGGWSRPYDVARRARTRPEAFDWLNVGGGLPRGNDHMDLILSMEEARRGGEFSVEIPVHAPCGCMASRGLAGCLHCQGTGTRRLLESVLFRVPPGVGHGHLLTRRMLDGRELRVRVQLSR